MTKKLTATTVPAGKPLPHRTTENTTYSDGKPVQRPVYTMTASAVRAPSDVARIRIASGAAPK